MNEAIKVDIDKAPRTFPAVEEAWEAYMRAVAAEKSQRTPPPAPEKEQI